MKRVLLCMCGFLVAFTLSFNLGGVAQALPLPICKISDGTGSVECLDGIPETNDSVDLLNDNFYFGYNDWIYLSKQEVGGSPNLEEPIDIDLTLSPTTGTNTGTYSFNPTAWSIYDDIIIVLKDGGIPGPNNDAYRWFAYLLGEGVSSGEWTYPGGKNLSHLSVYGREASPVAEAATMLLLGIGLVGLAGFGRNKFLKK